VLLVAILLVVLLLVATIVLVVVLLLVATIVLDIVLLLVATIVLDIVLLRVVIVLLGLLQAYCWCCLRTATSLFLSCLTCRRGRQLTPSGFVFASTEERSR
jgi:hypothetical protein